MNMHVYRKNKIGSKNSNSVGQSLSKAGFALVEVIVAAAIITVLFLFISQQLTDSRKSLHELSDIGFCNNLSTTLATSFKTLNNEATVRNVAAYSHTPISTAQSYTGHLCNSSREIGNILCDTIPFYSTSNGQANGCVIESESRYQVGLLQNHQNSASWALNFYNHCGAPGGICAGLTGNVCQGIEFTRDAAGLNDLSHFVNFLPERDTIFFHDKIKKVVLKVIPDSGCNSAIVDPRTVRFQIQADFTIGSNKVSPTPQGRLNELMDINNTQCTSKVEVTYSRDYSSPTIARGANLPITESPITLMGLRRYNSNIEGNRDGIVDTVSTEGSDTPGLGGRAIFHGVVGNGTPLTTRYIPNNYYKTGSDRIPFNLCDMEYNTTPIDGTLAPGYGLCHPYSRTLIVEADATEPGAILLCHKVPPGPDPNPMCYGYCVQMDLATPDGPNTGRLELLKKSRTPTEFNFLTKVITSRITFNDFVRLRLRWDNLPNGVYEMRFQAVDSSGNHSTANEGILFSINERGGFPGCDPALAPNYCPSQRYPDTAGNPGVCIGTRTCPVAPTCPAGTPGHATNPPIADPCNLGLTCPSSYVQGVTGCGASVSCTPAPTDICGMACTSHTCANCPPPSQVSLLCPTSSTQDLCGNVWQGTKNGCSDVDRNLMCPSENVIGTCGEQCGPGTMPSSCPPPEQTASCGVYDTCGRQCPGQLPCGNSLTCNNNACVDNSQATDNNATGKSFVHLNFDTTGTNNSLNPNFEPSTRNIYCNPNVNCTGNYGGDTYDNNVTFNIGDVWTAVGRPNHITVRMFFRFKNTGTCDWKPEIVGNTESGVYYAAYDVEGNTGGPNPYTFGEDCKEYLPIGQCHPPGIKHSITGMTGACAANGAGIVLHRAPSAVVCSDIIETVYASMFRRIDINGHPAGSFGRRYNIVGRICNTSNVSSGPPPGNPPPIDVPPPTGGGGAPCVRNCSAGKMSSYRTCQNVPDGCGGSCGNGTMPDCNVAGQCGSYRDSCGNSCNGPPCTGTCIPDCSPARLNLFCPGTPVNSLCPAPNDYCAQQGTRNTCPDPSTYCGDLNDDCGTACPIGTNCPVACTNECQNDWNCPGIPASQYCDNITFCEASQYTCELNNATGCNECNYRAQCPVCSRDGF